MEDSKVISAGRAGGLIAIQMAFRYLANCPDTHVLVGGVDTYYDGALIQLLVQDERLLAGGNMDGFIPGEGAAFLLLSRQRVALFRQSNKAVCLYEPGTSREAGYRGSKEPYRGDGLASALAQALVNAPIGTIKTLYSSLNGENYFAKEHGVAMLRNRERLQGDLKIEHPADCFGDLGSAFAPVAAAIAAVHLAGDNAASPCVLCCSSDRDARAAMVMDVA
jgi:3-oxoacyl-[acyl-carrier-protein] synthase-1